MAYYRFEEAKEPNFELFHKKCSEMFSLSFCHYFNHCMQNLNNTLSLNMGNASSNDQAFMRSQTLLPAKGGHSKKLTFCPHIIASTCKHWIFPLTEDFKVPAILKKFISKEAQNSSLDAANLKLYLTARPCLCDILLSNSKFTGSRKTCNRLVILHKVSKTYFFQTCYTCTCQILGFFGDPFHK